MNMLLGLFTLNQHQNHLEGLLKQIAGSSLVLARYVLNHGWGLRICVYYEFPGDADAANLGTTGVEY